MYNIIKPDHTSFTIFGNLTYFEENAHLFKIASSRFERKSQLICLLSNEATLHAVISAHFYVFNEQTKTSLVYCDVIFQSLNGGTFQTLILMAWFEPNILRIKAVLVLTKRVSIY